MKKITFLLVLSILSLSTCSMIGNKLLYQNLLQIYLELPPKTPIKFIHPHFSFNKPFPKDFYNKLSLLSYSEIPLSKLNEFLEYSSKICQIPNDLLTTIAKDIESSKMANEKEAVMYSILFKSTETKVTYINVIRQIRKSENNEDVFDFLFGLSKMDKKGFPSLSGVLLLKKIKILYKPSTSISLKDTLGQDFSRTRIDDLITSFQKEVLGRLLSY